MNSLEDMQNTPEYQELKLCTERKQEIADMITSLQLAETNRKKQWKELSHKLFTLCGSKGHVYGEEKLMEVEDGTGYKEETYTPELSSDYYDYNEMGGLPHPSDRKKSVRTVSYTKTKMVFTKTCTSCHCTSTRPASREVEVSYK